MRTHIDFRSIRVVRFGGLGLSTGTVGSVTHFDGRDHVKASDSTAEDADQISEADRVADARVLVVQPGAWHGRCSFSACAAIAAAH